MPATKTECMRYRAWRVMGLACVCALAVACGDTIVNLPTTPSQAGSTTPTIVKHTIQFRVIGNASSVRVRYSTPIDGLGQVVTSLPYFNTQTIGADSMFLSLEGAPISYGSVVLYPFLSVQIVVDNVVFREATTQDFLGSPLSVSGQWRQ